MSARTHHPNFGSSKYSLTWRPAKPESVSQVILSVEPSFNLRENQTLRHGFSSDIWFGPPWFERLATRKKQKQTVSMVWWSNLYVGHPHHRGTHPRRRCKTRSIHCRWPKLIGPGAKSSEIQAVQLEIRYAVSNGHEFCMSVRKLIGLFFVSLSTVLYCMLVYVYIVYSNCNVLHILKERERESCACVQRVAGVGWKICEIQARSSKYLIDLDWICCQKRLLIGHPILFLMLAVWVQVGKIMKWIEMGGCCAKGGYNITFWC